MAAALAALDFAPECGARHEHSTPARWALMQHGCNAGLRCDAHIADTHRVIAADPRTGVLCADCGRRFGGFAEFLGPVIPL